MSKRIVAYSATDVGSVRETNEDSYLCNPVHNIFVVADGMGGHADGKIASELACQILQDYLVQKIIPEIENIVPTEILHKIRLGFNHANNVIRKKNKQKYGVKAMGTTLSAIIVINEVIYYGNVGDTRIYLFPANEKEIILLSQDHTLERKLISQGTLPEFVEPHHKHTLTQAIGTQGSIDPNIGMIPEEETKKVILCTDGLYHYFTNQEIFDVISNNDHSNDENMKFFVKKSISCGGEDNITCILLDFL